MTITGTILGILFVAPAVLGIAKLLGYIEISWWWMLVPWLLLLALVTLLLFFINERSE